MSAPTFNAADIRAHVEMLHRLAAGIDGELVLAVFGEDPNQIDPESGLPGLKIPNTIERFRVGDIEANIAAIMRFDGVKHANPYMPLTVMRFGLPPGNRGKKEDILAVLGLIADLDADRGKVGRFPFEASFDMETSPGNFQPGIMFDQPIEPGQAEVLAKELRRLTQSDSGTGDINHVWRVPGTRNYPNAAKVRRGRLHDPAPVLLTKPWAGEVFALDFVQAALAREASNQTNAAGDDSTPNGAGAIAKPSVEAKSDNDDVAAIFAKLPPKTQFDVTATLPEGGNRSPHCMRAIKSMIHARLTDHDILTVTAAYPEGIFGRYHEEGKDLAAEIRRAREHIEKEAAARTAKPSISSDGAVTGAPVIVMKWHGDANDDPLKEWLVDRTLPKSGVALLSGQWGTYKTFAVLDLAGCVIAKTPFARRPVNRQGGVLLFAAEGQEDVRVRLEGLLAGKLRESIAGGLELPVDPRHLPFAWVDSCPTLASPGADVILRNVIDVAASAMLERHGMPLALIIIDTMMTAAGFRDANDSAEAQRVMKVLGDTARHFGLLVLAVDHFGKDVSAGTRNSSVKEDNVDAVLALLGDKALEGRVRNPRLAIRKVRGAPAGAQIPFTVRVVKVVDTAFESADTLVIDWSVNDVAEIPIGGPDKIFPTSILCFIDSLDETLSKSGKKQRPFGDDREFLCVNRLTVRDAFYVKCKAKTQKAKNMQFRRSELKARELGIVDWAGNDAEMLFWRPAAASSDRPRKQH